MTVLMVRHQSVFFYYTSHLLLVFILGIVISHTYCLIRILCKERRRLSRFSENSRKSFKKNYDFFKVSEGNANAEIKKIHSNSLSCI